MGLFGKKKEQNNVPAENKTNSVSDEMKIILAAREEDKQEKIARAEERQQAQEAASKEELFKEQQASEAADRIVNGDVIPKGMTFYMLCDELPYGAVPEKEGNIVIRGNVRGTAKADSDVFLYQGAGDRFKVRIEKIRNDNREFVDEVTNERAELEITRGDIPLPTDPDADASSTLAI